MSHARQGLARRGVALFLWAYAVWILLTWTRTWSQLVFGAGFAAAVAIGCAPLGPVAEPWRLLSPRRLAAFALLALDVVRRIVLANLRLARRIWSPSRPLRSGMIVVPTAVRGEGALAAVGVLTSVIVDNQIVDLNVGSHELQYHAVSIESGDGERNRATVNGPVEDGLRRAGVR